ncbi:MAG: hypothetical protein MUC50_22890 [Myxococcota bacterium]|nr:hypothetical protein [Myxococcota bacterium]
MPILRLLLATLVAASWFAVGSAMAEDNSDLEVVAKLVEIPGSLPPDDLYDYAYVMKYEVVEGPLAGKTLYVAHYKPTRKRSDIKDKMKGVVTGSLKKFKVGEVHSMRLAPNLKKVWAGPVTDDYFAVDRGSPRYFCLRVDPK